MKVRIEADLQRDKCIICNVAVADLGYKTCHGCGGDDMECDVICKGYTISFNTEKKKKRCIYRCYIRGG